MVAKCGPRGETQQGDIYFEANLLQGLQHPGIPTICELIETDTTTMLFESYIDGVTLDRYLLYHQVISRETFLKIAIQICGIIEYLHSHRPNPILYLDMKPSHIMLQGSRVTLIDYGIARVLPDSGNVFQTYGTKPYAAPEQESGEPLSFATDVYGVGKVLELMLSHVSKKEAIGLRRIVHCATKSNQFKRTQSIQKLRNQLERRLKSRNKKDREHLVASVAIVGSDRGVGCTHFAIALVSHLNRAGFTAYYRNRTEQRVLENLDKQLKQSENKDGFIYHESFVGAIGGNHEGNINSFLGIQIIDCGTDQADIEADITIHVCGGRVWQRSSFSKWELRGEDLLVANFASRDFAKELARRYNHRVYLFSQHSNPFISAVATKRVLSAIMKHILKTRHSQGERG